MPETIGDIVNSNGWSEKTKNSQQTKIKRYEYKGMVYTSDNNIS